MGISARKLSRASNRVQSSGENLLVSKTFTSTVGDSTSEPGNPPARITDQDLETRWISQPTSPVTLVADLEAIYDLSRIVITWAADTVRNFTISVSNDASSWQTIYSGTTSGSAQKETVSYTSFSASTTGRYLRIIGTDRWNGSYGNSIWEVEAYGTLNTSIPTGTIANFTATATGETTVALSWSYSGATLSNFTLRRGGSTIASPAAGATSYSDSGLSAGTNYSYTLTGNYQAGGTTGPATANAQTTGGGGNLQLRVSTNKRHFETTSGQPFLVVADTCWTLMTELSIANAKQYIDIRKAQGYNTIMTNVVAFFRTESGPRGTAFVSGNVTQWNASYFDGIDEIIAYAASQDMVIMLNGLWYANAGGWDDSLGQGAPSASQMTTYGTMLANRYKDTPNLIWFVGGDEQASVVWSSANALANALHSTDPNHILTYHPRWDSYSDTSGQAWLDFNSFQKNDNTSPYLYSLTATGYNLSPTRPIFCIEPPYDPQTAVGGVNTTPLYHRQNVWGSMLAGALGVAYGGPRNAWAAGKDTGGSLVLGDLNRTAATQTQHVRAILGQYDWHKLVPNNGIVTSGLGSDRTRATAGRASDGTLMVVYVGSQRSITVNVSQLSGSATARWYNPATGTQVGGNISVSNSGTMNFSAPNSEDSVLVIAV